MPELEGQVFLELLNKVYATGEPYIGKETPISIEAKTGVIEKCFLNYNYQAYKNAADIIEGILVFAYDVTQQVTAREQLERNAEMIRNLYMNAPAFICTFQGPEHTYTLVNPSYQKIFGTRGLVGKPILDALPELKGQGFDTILDNVYNTGETYVGIEIPIALARDEGLKPEVRYFNFSYQPIYNEHKIINGILVFGYEVTEMVIAKKIQSESDKRFRILADAMPQKMSTTDAEGNLTYLNQQWVDFTHKSVKEINTDGWKSIIHPDDYEPNQHAWEHALATGEKYSLEQRFRCHDGTYRWHLSRRVAQKDENGKIISWIGTYTDINEQKVFAEELAKQVQDGLKLDKQKNDFISMASHELKTPLTSIKAYTQLLQHSFESEGDGEVGIFLERMDNQITKLTFLIDDLLDSSKVKAGQLVFNEKLFDFNELANEIIDEMQKTTQTHTINVKLETTDMIFGDRIRIGQVMSNMLSNAIKYSPAANKINVTSIHKDDTILFCVQDFGIGIRKENKKHIFDQFYRVSGTVEDTFPGLGLGMFIASEIITRARGIISVESEFGKGSSFCFALPIENKALKLLKA